MDFVSFLNESKKYDDLLAKQASYYDDYRNFSYAYSSLILRPIYWHWTNDSKFLPNPYVSPSDAVGGFGTATLREPIGALMACAYPSNWSKDMLGVRNYLAMLDISDLIPAGQTRKDLWPKDYTFVQRGYDEISIHANAFDKIKVIKVYDANSGKRTARRIWSEFPKTEAELRNIYDRSHQNHEL